jgi:phosphomannomutase
VEDSIAANAAGTPPRMPWDEAEAAGRIEYLEPFAGYERFVRRSLDLDKLKGADMRVLVDPLYGSGSGWTSRLLAGGRIVVDEIHSERNPWFGGVNPEPIRPHVDEALERVRDGGYDLGLLLDGDAGPADIELAARLVARFSQGRDAGHVTVEVHDREGGSKSLDVVPLPADQIPDEWYL